MKNTPNCLVGFTGFLWLIFSANFTFALSVGVPKPERMVKEADTIVIGRYLDLGSTAFTLDEVLKSEVILPRVAQTYSPYSPDALERDIRMIQGDQTILLGRWVPDKNAVMVLYASSSFWPQGVPQGGQPTGTVNELRAYILTQLRDSGSIRATMPASHPPEPSPKASVVGGPTQVLPQPSDRPGQVPASAELPSANDGSTRDLTRPWGWMVVVFLIAATFVVIWAKRR